MNIPQISFGRTIKVNSSAMDAQKIADIANGYCVKNTPNSVYEQAKNIFDDTNKGEARVVGFRNNSDMYIVSGKESQEIQKLQDNLQDNMHRFYTGSSYGNFYASVCDLSREDFFEGIERIINQTKEPRSIDVEHNAKGDQITNLDIKG